MDAERDNAASVRCEPDSEHTLANPDRAADDAVRGVHQPKPADGHEREHAPVRRERGAGADPGAVTAGLDGAEPCGRPHLEPIEVDRRHAPDERACEIETVLVRGERQRRRIDRVEISVQRKFDAMRNPGAQVERVDEGRTVRLQVEREEPRAIAGLDRGHRLAAHLLLRLVEPRRAEAPAGSVVLLQVIAPGPAPVDEVQAAPIRGERLELVRAREPNRLCPPRLVQRQHGPAGVLPELETRDPAAVRRNSDHGRSARNGAQSLRASGSGVEAQEPGSAFHVDSRDESPPVG